MQTAYRQAYGTSLLEKSLMSLCFGAAHPLAGETALQLSRARLPLPALYTVWPLATKTYRLQLL